MTTYKTKSLKDPLFLCCCYGYAINGMAVLVIGSILPALIAEAGISFSAAGGLLSLMAIGNFLASFIFPAAVSSFGRKMSITVSTALVPVSFIGLTFLPPLSVLYILMFLSGIARGSITIINNSAVNDLSENPAKMLNYLHCSFAVGAFTAPFATAVFFGLGFSWRMIILILTVLCASSCVFYAMADYSRLPDTSKKAKEKNGNVEDKSFLKNVNFYCICFLLFFYVGFENCVNGWFVTYLQSTGIVTAAFSSILVSATWIVIMIGRLICASLSSRMTKSSIVLGSCLGSAIFFFLLISSGSLPLITLSLVGLGFCMAGIYPTAVADIGGCIKGSTLGMAMLTAISSLGGIVTPQLVGSVADHIGIVPAVGTLSVNAVIMILLAVINYVKLKKKGISRG